MTTYHQYIRIIQKTNLKMKNAKTLFTILILSGMFLISCGGSQTETQVEEVTVEEVVEETTETEVDTTEVAVEETSTEVQ